jgi:hypothetical protein
LTSYSTVLRAKIPSFIEVEDAHGVSIRVGEWVQRNDGYWVLRMDDPRTLAVAQAENARMDTIHAEQIKRIALLEALLRRGLTLMGDESPTSSSLDEDDNDEMDRWFEWVEDVEKALPPAPHVEGGER